jgi:heptosyltransferase-1
VGGTLKILILKPSSLGDVVQALPVLRCLKRHRPDSEIYWWISSALAPLIEKDHDLAGVIHFERNGWAAPRPWVGLWRSMRWARAQRFDWVIDLQCLARSGAFAWLANGQLTVGLDEPREGARGFYDLIARRPSYHTHAVDWYLGVLPLLRVPVPSEFDWLPPQPETAARLKQKWPETGGARWVAIQPGGRWLNKRWPVESYAAVVQRLAAENDGVRFAILGAAEDRALGSAIARVAPQQCLDLTGQVSLSEMVEWIRLSEVLVTNDTGPMHVAAALGKRVVALFGPTEPRRTGPYGQLQHVLQQRELPCVPCLKSRCSYSKPMECLRSIPPEPVFQAVQKCLSRIHSEDNHG